MTARTRIAVAMSGGVDSSVAALVLQRQGLDVQGVTFRLFPCDWAAGNDATGSCCSTRDVNDAVRVADRLAIPHSILDLSDIFVSRVVQPFCSSYKAGETPNPCILCNQHVKFDAFLAWALEHGFDAIATGHHARIESRGNRLALLPGADIAKDQTYFLFAMSQQTLARVLFPVGIMAKQEVRERAAAAGLQVAEKKESQEICFAAGGSYADFLERHGGLRVSPGPIVLADGSVVGEHQGLHRYTIGQRKGLGVAAAEPLYVLRRDSSRNQLVVGPREALLEHCLTAHSPIWTRGQPPAPGTTVKARIRYRSDAVPARITACSKAGFSLSFEAPVAGIAPGQAVVLYDRLEVMGGGWIQATDSRDSRHG